MAKKLQFMKSATGLVPMSQEATDWYNKLPAGNIVTGKFAKKQNAQFHRKMFALLNLGFDNWQQPPVPVDIAGNQVVPEKNFDRFRKDVTILAGFFHVVYRLDGTSRIEADSLAFDKMPAEDREECFQKMLTVLLANVYGGQVSEAQMDNMINQYLSYA